MQTEFLCAKCINFNNKSTYIKVYCFSLSIAIGSSSNSSAVHKVKQMWKKKQSVLQTPHGDVDVDAAGQVYQG